MYQRYYNSYEKKAQQIKAETAAKHEEIKEPAKLPEKRGVEIKNDDLLLLGLIFFLWKEGKADKMLLLALGYIFVSGFYND